MHIVKINSTKVRLKSGITDQENNHKEGFESVEL